MVELTEMEKVVLKMATIWFDVGLQRKADQIGIDLSLSKEETQMFLKLHKEIQNKMKRYVIADRPHCIAVVDTAIQNEGSGKNRTDSNVIAFWNGNTDININGDIIKQANDLCDILNAYEKSVQRATSQS